MFYFFSDGTLRPGGRLSGQADGLLGCWAAVMLGNWATNEWPSGRQRTNGRPAGAAGRHAARRHAFYYFVRFVRKALFSAIHLPRDSITGSMFRNRYVVSQGTPRASS